MITNPTMTTYQRWPFLPASTHTPEQRQQWWQECFIATPEVARFVHAETSAVLIGGPGSGKSTAVAALQYILNEPLLLIPYPPYHWPQRRQTLGIQWQSSEPDSGNSCYGNYAQAKRYARGIPSRLS
jgi:hypothetical protein